MDEASRSSKIDFPNLIALALQKCLPWDSLSIIFDNVTLTEEEYKILIKLLLKKLQRLQEEPKEPIKNLQKDETTEVTKDENVSYENTSEFKFVAKETVKELYYEIKHSKQFQNELKTFTDNDIRD